MQIQFYGAAQRVTGSKHLLTTKQGTKILLDCGLFQGIGTQELNQSFGFNPKDIDYLILSHAHIDHSGLIPRLVAQGFEGKIFSTPATFDLCSILLGDSAKIQETDIKRMNKRRSNRGEELLETLYSYEDVEKSLTLFDVQDYHHAFKVCDEVTAVFYDTGHILGSASVFLTIWENNHAQKLFFTGDIGRPNDKILRSPEPFPQADYIICESTYGDRLHEPEADVKAHLLDIVNRVCVEQQGKLLIPAFSIDRTQELIYALDQLHYEGELPEIKVFIDSPLSVNATKIMDEHEECFNSDLLAYLRKDRSPFSFPNLHYVSDVEESKRINELKEPCIIISASGMAEAGRIKHHIANNIENPSCAVLLVGYASADSLAGQLKSGAKEVRIFGETFAVRAEVLIMDSFSAHADYQEIMGYLGCQNKEKVKKLFLVHGEIDTQQAFKARLYANGWQHIEIPAMKQKFDL
jgi:metallo-beta-lactamase family protein